MEGSVVEPVEGLDDEDGSKDNGEEEEAGEVADEEDSIDPDVGPFICKFCKVSSRVVFRGSVP